MSLKCRLKIRAVNSLTDGRYFAALGAEWLTFCFDPESTDFVTPQIASEIMPWLAGPELVADFGDGTKAPIPELTKALDLKRIEFSIKIPEAVEASKYQQVYRRIAGEQALNMGTVSEIVKNEKLVNQTFVLDYQGSISKPEDLKAIDIDRLKELCNKEQIILSIKPEIEIADQLLSLVNPLGIEIAAGKEEATGLRAFDDVDPLMEWLELD